MGLLSGSLFSFLEFDYNFFLSYASGGQIKNILKPKAILSLLNMCLEQSADQ